MININRKLLPSKSENVVDFILYRQAYSDEIILKVSGNSFVLNIGEAKKWMKIIGVEVTLIDRVIDYLWNFRCLKFSLNTQRFVYQEYEYEF